MKINNRWLKKELEKDKRDIKTHKANVIKEILNTSKKEITQGPQNKMNKWTRIKKRIKQFFKL
jgi:hypothetical protein